MKKLSEYNNKRNFKITKEPIGKIKKTSKYRFCIQHHLATKDHYDFRLEYNGVLLSFAIPKGPCYNPNIKRLAIKVEDHPISYIKFEGIIPKQEYGGGIVMLFDIGTYKLIEKTNKKIKFILYGKRMKGTWTLVHVKENNWIIIKDKDYYSNFIDINLYKRSIKTNRTMEEIKNNEKNIKDNNIIQGIEISNAQKLISKNPKITKLDIINYFDKIADKMLPFLENRIISVVRAPEGLNKDHFFKKHLENKNNYLQSINLNKDKYYYILDKTGIISEVQMNSYELHIWENFVSDKNHPNLMVFDLDPDEKLQIAKVREAAKELKKILDKLNFKSYLKTSGGKGYHIVVPIFWKITWKKLEKISREIAEILVQKDPTKYTTNMRKENRKGKIFIDYFRNQKGATFVAPYSIRLKPNLPVSMPISWNELDKVLPNQITMNEALKRIKRKDPWKDFFIS